MNIHSISPLYLNSADELTGSSFLLLDIYLLFFLRIFLTIKLLLRSLLIDGLLSNPSMSFLLCIHGFLLKARGRLTFFWTVRGVSHPLHMLLVLLRCSGLVLTGFQIRLLMGMYRSDMSVVAKDFLNFVPPSILVP
jgi:hypothetical protein